MREIKFRAWDKVQNEMTGHSSEILALRKERFELMQYTGLKDKNGKEIYEGDILRVLATKEYPKDTRTAAVIWGNDLQWQVQSENYNFGLPLTWGAWKKLQVIGNIYENPELLK